MRKHSENKEPLYSTIPSSVDDATEVLHNSFLHQHRFQVSLVCWYINRRRAAISNNHNINFFENDMFYDSKMQATVHLTVATPNM